MDVDQDVNNIGGIAYILGNKVWKDILLSNQQQKLIAIYHEQYGISINSFFTGGYKIRATHIKRIAPRIKYCNRPFNVSMDDMSNY